jgi:DNA-binding transcriptional MerR regulator
VLLIRRIRDLLYEQGFTINGARNRLETETFDSQPEPGEGGVPGTDERRATALSPDQLRQVIEEIRQLLGAGG